MAVLTSLSGASATGAGTVSNSGAALTTPTSHATMQVVLTGNPTLYQVNLEGSLDGTHWFTMGTCQSAGFNFTVVHSDLNVYFLRANLTQLSGGMSPTVTALIAYV